MRGRTSVAKSGHADHRQWTGLLVVALVTLIASLCSGPSAHQFLHPDAQVPAHECSLTPLADGHGLLAGIVTTPLPPSPDGIAIPWRAPVESGGNRDLRLAPCRAPPAGGRSHVG